MPNKRIALFLDGTWNTVNDNTNVWRMKSLCAQGSDQEVYYSAGVGTQYGSKIIGGMFGVGLDDEVINAYEWLIDHYVAGAHIFIFGFSRGAFTARSLAGFISICGLLKSGSPVSVKQLYGRYRKASGPSIRGLDHVKPGDLSLEDRLVQKYSMPVPIWFQGVWDTVGALGIPIGTFPVVSRSDYAFLETDLRISNDYAYHALAIDEHRKAFAPTLWQKTASKVKDNYPPRPLADVEQRWFIGAHANVGGGYENDLLAQLPLRWLMLKAASHGLVFREDILIDGDENTATIEDSFAHMAGGVYRLLEFNHRYYRTIGAEPVESKDSILTTINETIDVSVFDRWRANTEYRPENLADWATRRNAKIEALTSSVLAADPSQAAPEF